MNATQGIGCHPAYVGFEDILAQLKCCFCLEYLVPRAQRVAMDWTNHEVVQRWEELDDRFYTENYKSGNQIWMDVSCNND